MFVTIRKNEFRVHDDASGNIMFVKSMPEEVLDAQLSGDSITVTTTKRTQVFKRIGSTYAFSFFREFSRQRPDERNKT